MRLLIQRVKQASVEIDGAEYVKDFAAHVRSVKHKSQSGKVIVGAVICIKPPEPVNCGRLRFTHAPGVESEK